MLPGLIQGIIRACTVLGWHIRYTQKRRRKKKIQNEPNLAQKSHFDACYRSPSKFYPFSSSKGLIKMIKEVISPYSAF